MTAANRVGILSAVTKAMADLGSDLRQASQTVVRGYFTMIFSAEFPEHIEQQVIIDHLQDTCRPFGIDVNLKDPAAEKINLPSMEEAKLRLLRLGGENKPGVLRQLSTMISMRRIDIVGMHAVRTGGGTGFEMIMKIAIPDDMNTEDLLNELNTIGQSFNITADLSDYVG
ncbi:ACT domain-containing protein [Fuerstiella marisgermanici]|nr:ACT domain-containing protein [Fuerstiella marisgermanici]